MKISLTIFNIDIEIQLCIMYNFYTIISYIQASITRSSIKFFSKLKNLKAILTCGTTRIVFTLILTLHSSFCGGC